MINDGVSRKYHVDNGERTITFVSVQDVEPILDLNKEDRSETQTSDWSRRIARVPSAVMLQWFHEEHRRGNTQLRMYSKEFDELMFKKLNDPDYAYLRTDRKPTIIRGFA